MNKKYKIKENALETILKILEELKFYKISLEKDIFTIMNTPNRINQLEQTISILEELIEEDK